jgi:hypothetical protein
VVFCIILQCSLITNIFKEHAASNCRTEAEVIQDEKQVRKLAIQSRTHDRALHRPKKYVKEEDF